MSRKKIGIHMGTTIGLVTMVVLAYLAGGKLIVTSAVNEFKSAVIKGAPQYNSESLSENGQAVREEK